ncbi:MAG TPA: hypothetical protein VEA61_05560 [Allosphingosinicella sp.]|nr:hypothetical protein [Allosphingosinicella sp.]
MLNEFEIQLVAAIAESRPVCFEPEEKAVLRAEVLRRLLLEMPPDGKMTKVALPGRCLTIEGALIEGRVELDDARGGEGGEIPALVFRRCTFDSGFSGNHGRFARLGFLDCQFEAPPRPESPSISLNGATIGSDVDISDSRGLTEEGAFWVEARGALVDGMFVAARARLRGPVPREKAPDTEYGRLALHLGQAHVTGDMILMPGFAAIGGMSIQNARVDGDIWARGALFTTGEGSAFKASYARLAGYVSFGTNPGEDGVPERTKVVGKMDFYGAEIGGSVELTGAMVGWSDSSPLAQKADYLALGFYRAKIDGHVTMEAEIASDHGMPFEAYGLVSLDAVEIGTFLSLNGAELNAALGPHPPGMAGLSLNHARIGASCGGVRRWAPRRRRHTCPPATVRFPVEGCTWRATWCWTALPSRAISTAPAR